MVAVEDQCLVGEDVGAVVNGCFYKSLMLIGLAIRSCVMFIVSSMLTQGISSLLTGIIKIQIAMLLQFRYQTPRRKKQTRTTIQEQTKSPQINAGYISALKQSQSSQTIARRDKSSAHLQILIAIPNHRSLNHSARLDFVFQVARTSPAGRITGMLIVYLD